MEDKKHIIEAAAAHFAAHPDETECFVTEDTNVFYSHGQAYADAHAAKTKSSVYKVERNDVKKAHSFDSQKRNDNPEGDPSKATISPVNEAINGEIIQNGKANPMTQKERIARVIALYNEKNVPEADRISINKLGKTKNDDLDVMIDQLSAMEAVTTESTTQPGENDVDLTLLDKPALVELAAMKCPEINPTDLGDKSEAELIQLIKEAK